MSSLSRTSLLLTALCSLGLSGSVVASDLKEPYQIRVVVHIDRDPLLTDVFGQQVKRQLGDGLQAALGALAKVEVVDTHPKLLEIRSQGLGRALDRHRERSPYHTHFVLIDFSGTHYQVRTRMHDGLTGLPSPVVRKDRTRDRAYVARTVAFLMERDIGLLGTVASEPDAARQVKLELRGGGLGVDLSRWVKKGEVFRLVRAEGGSDQPLEWAFLQVVDEASDGACTCKFFSRYKLPRVAGLRAVLLGTRVGPLRLRLLQEKVGGGVGPLRTAVSLQFRKHGFEGEDVSRLQPTATSGREVNTEKYGDKGRFDRLAFVSVLTGDSLRARVPIPILDDSQTVLVVPTTNEEGDVILSSFRDLLRELRQAASVQAQQFRQINELTSKPEKRTEALAVVRGTLDRLQKDHARLKTEWDDVKKEIDKLNAKDRPRPQELAAIEKRLRDLKSGEGDLLRHVELLEKIDKEENDPRKKEALSQVEQAKLLEKDGEVGKALAIYAKLPAEFVTPELKKHVDGLKEAWKPRDEAHAAARRYVYDTLPGLDTPGLREGLKEAARHFGVMEKAGDVLGATRLKKALEQHADRMFKELNELKPTTNIDDEKPAQVIKELAAELQKLDPAIQGFLDRGKPGG